jgi:hypothetical protein
MDPSKKTMRHFYCRDVLWETFEQMANDFDCSIDYLINEAMRYYARSKNYQAPAGSEAVPSKPGAEPATRPPPTGGPRKAPPLPPPGPPDMGGTSSPPTLQRKSSQGPATAAAGARRSAPPTTDPTVPPTGSESAPTLYLFFNNQKFTIDKDQFIIGRGSKTSDLAIKDGNISRKHAAVIRRNGTYYIKDLGSTNGIDYKGMRIDNKRIDEGDVFHLCDYELRFTYGG